MKITWVVFQKAFFYGKSLPLPLLVNRIRKSVDSDLLNRLPHKIRLEPLLIDCKYFSRLSPYLY